MIKDTYIKDIQKRLKLDINLKYDKIANKYYHL